MTQSLISILLIVSGTYIWNRFIPPFLIGLLVKFHKRNNQKNIDKHPVKFLITHESSIVKFIRWFYWLGAAVASCGIIINN